MNFKLLIHWQRNALKNTLLRLLVYTINAIIFFWLLLIFAWGAFQLVVPETFHCCMLLVGLFPALNAVMHQIRIRSLLPHGCCPVHSLCWSSITFPTFWFQLTLPAPQEFSVTALDHQGSSCKCSQTQPLTASGEDHCTACCWDSPSCPDHTVMLQVPLVMSSCPGLFESRCWPILVSIAVSSVSPSLTYPSQRDQDTAWWLPTLNATAATNT